MNYQKNLINYIENKNQEGIIDTNISALKFFITTEQSEFTSVVYEPSLCIILQGEKAIGFADEMYSYDSTRYLLACTHIPVKVKINMASKDLPYIALMVKFSLEEIYEVLKQTTNNQIEKRRDIQKGFCLYKLDETLLEPIYRLVKLLDKNEKDIEFLSSLIKKEIIYTLLQTNSDFLKHHVLEGTLTNQIVKAISEIKNNFDKTINMKNLSKSIGISESSLYQNFKKVTSMSPLQFQKKIRLEEAKNILLSQNVEASEVAFSVGYESPSQFSREYSRMFGMSPKAHSFHIKNNNIA